MRSPCPPQRVGTNMIIWKIAVIAALTAAGCSARNGADSSDSRTETAAPGSPARPAPVPARPAETALQRSAAIGRAVANWRSAPDLGAARRHAEAARNLIVGPRGPAYGDADGDGTTSGANRIGLLPGLDGGGALAMPAANPCVTRDLLGGDWSAPRRRWEILQQKIDAWRPERNTFPTLPSHAQRVVGWATLTLKSNDLATAREYAGHAQIHVDVMRRALNDC